MAVAMLLAGRDAPEPVIGPATAERFAGLGITRVSLLRDASGIGVVLEGWSFDPSRVGEAVRAMFPDQTADVRVLYEIEQVAVAEPAEGRTT